MTPAIESSSFASLVNFSTVSTTNQQQHQQEYTLTFGILAMMFPNFNRTQIALGYGFAGLDIRALRSVLRDATTHSFSSAEASSVIKTFLVDPGNSDIFSLTSAPRQDVIAYSHGES